MEYVEFTKLIKESIKSNNNFNNRVMKVNDELIGFTLKYLTYTREFIAMESTQFKTPVNITVDHNDFIEKYKEEFRLILKPENLEKLFELICSKCPCLELVQEETKTEEIVNILFSSVLNNTSYTIFKLDLNKLDDMIIFPEPVKGIVMYNDPQITGINIRKEPNRESLMVGKVKYGDKLLILGENESYYKLADGYINKNYVGIE